MRPMRFTGWGLPLLGLVMGALAVGCSTAKETSGLKSPHPLVRKAAIERLAANPDMSSYNLLVDVLSTDEDRLVRSQAAFALGRLSERYYSVAFEPLARALEADSSAFVRAAAAVALSYNRDSRAVSVLVRALDDRARGEMSVRYGDKAVTYKACVADAARTSLEKVVGLRFTGSGNSAGDQRQEVASLWSDWYMSRADRLPDARAFASK